MDCPPLPVIEGRDPLGRRRWVVGGLGAAFGVACWAVFVVGTGPQDIAVGLLLVITGLTAVVLAFLFEVPPVVSGVPVVVAPLLVAGWTAPRGDNDGLWAIILLYLAGWVFILVGVCEGIRRWRTRRRWGTPGDRLVDTHRQVAAGVTATAGVVALVLLWAAFPDPWPDMAKRLATFPPPTGFRDVSLQRSGDPRCGPEVACGPDMTRVMTADLDGPAACRALERAMHRWQPDATVGSAKPINAPPLFFEICAFTAKSPATGIWLAKSVISKPDGQPTEARVTAYPEDL